MKTRTLLFVYLLATSLFASGQITSPVIKANFGVDADLNANYFNGASLDGNDDWFRSSAGMGDFVIDTTGAAALLAQYISNPASRLFTFNRFMRFAPFTVVNNSMLLAAVFTRDFHGDDSTIFASGSNKNGMSPQSWSTPIAQSVPDKNEILDMMVHLRRAGPAASDSLWLIGGISIENTTGNRYFDFEMYQTDLVYNRSTLNFSGYGPDAGHTSWKFDAAGNVTQPGDIIFTAEYSSSSLTLIEARIWVKKTDWQSVTPTAFSWNGAFDGDGNGAAYGYASIAPNTAGTFYTGLQSANGTWAGPFSLVLGDNSIVTTYAQRQFMEFSVNLSKLGLDPFTTLGNTCTMPFKRIMVKSRASTSFTSELKDFVAPVTIFNAAQATVATNTPYMCTDGSVSNLYVTNPVSTSTYTWSTTDGVISGSTTGSSINVSSPGTYMVTQYLQSGCAVYSSDDIQVFEFPACEVLTSGLLKFNGEKISNQIVLKWSATESSSVDYFELERSVDSTHFISIHTTQPKIETSNGQYSFIDKNFQSPFKKFYYRLHVKMKSGASKYSNTLAFAFSNDQQLVMHIYPNPVKNDLHILVSGKYESTTALHIYDMNGRLVKKLSIQSKGFSQSNAVTDVSSLAAGLYKAVLQNGNTQFVKNFIVTK